MSFRCNRSLTFPHAAMGWSVVCDCGILTYKIINIYLNVCVLLLNVTLDSVINFAQSFNNLEGARLVLPLCH